MERGDAACVTDASQPESTVKEDLDYFAQLADTYLLSEGNLAADLQDMDGGLEDPKPSQTEKKPGSRKVDDGLLRFTWEGSSPALRNSSEPSWNAQGNKSAADLMDTLATEKARAEPGDSSEWEQTREHLSSLPIMKHTDSPESVLMGGGTGASANASAEEQPHGLGPSSAAGGGGDTGFGPRSPFIRGDRAGGGNPGSESMQMPGSQTGQQQFGRLSDFPGLDHESLTDMPTGDMWEPRRGGFPNVPIDSAFRHHGRHDSFWADPADMPGGSDTGFMPGRAAGSDRMAIYRMHSDMTGAPLRDSRYPARRQYSADLAYDLLPRGGSVDGLGAPGPSGLDPVFEQHISMPQMDVFGGMRLGATGSMPMGTPPSGRGPLFYGGGQVPMPETPLLDSSRKRMREHYYPANEHSMPQHERIPAGSRANPRQVRREKLSQEEHLINTLKRQIAALDPQTKATLKDSLYRISRNTNARVNGMGEPPQQRMSSRNSFVDRVVANLMYNRFEPGGPSALRTPSGLGGGLRPSSLGSPYGGSMPPLSGPRMGGSSNLPMDMKPPMRLENSPNA